MSLRFLVETHYARIRDDVEFWRPHIEEIARRHGLSMSTYEPTRGDAKNAVFFVGDAIVKIYTPYFHGRETRGMEPAVLRALANDPQIVVPKVRATGDLFMRSGDWSWPYVVMSRVPGWVLEPDWAGLDEAAKAALLKELGSVLARLHKMPPSAELGTTYHKLWPKGFQGFLARQLEALQTLPDLAALPLADDLRGLTVPSATPAWPIILHGDIEPAHLFHEKGTLKAVIDFGDAKLGDPLYDFVAIRKSMATEKPLLDALFEGYGSDPRTSEEGRQKLGLYTVLHEWTTPKDLSTWCARTGTRTINELGHWLWN